MNAYSLEQFLRGVPETILPPMGPRSVLIAWQHTNEELAPRAMHHLLNNRPDLVPHVGYVCGNPLTAATDPEKGFTETDLNRSYIKEEPKSYEEKQAVKLLKLAKSYPYVLDLHGAVGDTPDIIIVAENRVHEPTVEKLIAASKNRHIIVMPRSIADNTLIGVTSNCIVMEYYVDRVDHAIRAVEETIARLVSGKVDHKPFEREFFYVSDTVSKKDDPGLNAQNFEFINDSQGGYYPVLLGTGPRSYRQDPTKDYCCFAARRKETRIL